MENHPQLATETVLGTPLQLRDDDGDRIVEVRDQNGRKVELKRFDPTSET